MAETTLQTPAEPTDKKPHKTRAPRPMSPNRVKQREEATAELKSLTYLLGYAARNPQGFAKKLQQPLLDRKLMPRALCAEWTKRRGDPRREGPFIRMMRGEVAIDKETLLFLLEKLGWSAAVMVGTFEL